MSNHAAVDPCAIRNRSKDGKKKRCWLSIGSGLMQWDINDIDRTWDVLELMRDRHNVDTIVIEDGYVGYFNDSVLRLETTRGIIEGFAKRLGLKVARVKPSMWQGILKGAPQKKVKDKAVWYAEQLPIAGQLPGYPEREDAADAACIWEFYEMIKRRESLKRKGNNV